MFTFKNLKEIWKTWKKNEKTSGNPVPIVVLLLKLNYKITFIGKGWNTLLFTTKPKTPKKLFHLKYILSFIF